MGLTIDASELFGFADVMLSAASSLESEMKTASAGLLLEGIGLAQGAAPVKDGTLRGSIHILDGPSATGGSYGTDLIYAAQREYGGTIVPRNGKFLVFEIGGQLIFARSVTQSGSHYMQKSADQLEPKVLPAYSAAVDRVLAAL